MDPVLPGVARIELRTPTLPPATHTNTWVVGTEALTVVDPASPYDDERGRLWRALDDAAREGRTVRRLFLTHHHADHVGGAVALRDALAAAGRPAPIAAHPVTAALLADRVVVDELVEDGDEIEAGVRAIHTPGHAPGHLCLAGDGWIVAGDMVAGVGTILLDPAEGDLDDYLRSLARLGALGRDVLLPAHGPALPNAATVLSMYAAHRNARSEQVLAALDRAGAARADDLVPAVYRDLDPRARPIAAAQIETHLRWLVRHGRAGRVGDRYVAAG
jgi:ribonuclease/clavin/mitogillin